MYRSILVPLDGSTFAEHALPLALLIAKRAEAQLRLVHVLPPLASVYAESPLFMEDDLEARIKERLHSYLDGMASRLRKLAPIAVNTMLLDGEITPSLRRHALDTKPDLVVMTTHGRGPLGRLWLGSVADELLRHLTMPLLLVRASESAPDLSVEPPLKHILIPLDGAPLAERMIERALELGQSLDANYTLLRVVKPIPPISYPAPSASAIEPEMQAILRRIDTIEEQMRQEALAYLEGVAKPLRAKGLRVQTRVAIEEQPASAILHEATPLSADLIALETHGRGGLSRMWLGSVADKVIRGATMPVLVHRPQQT